MGKKVNASITSKTDKIDIINKTEESQKPISSCYLQK